MKQSLVLILAASALAGGCVPVEKYNALKLEARSYEESLQRAQADAKAQRALAEAAQQRLKDIDGNGNNLAGMMTNLQQQLAAKQTELDELNRRYAEAVGRAGLAGALPQPLTNELVAFANANPDLVEFDQSRGIVKFRSDVTFDVGDATIKPKAREVLQKFSTILNGQVASQYELLVAGHTDSMPVNNPETIRKGHKNNWYLSAHRAIAVTDELVKEKVGAQRLGAVGYADQRPVASNATEAGKTANRRVEVLILPTQVKSSAPSAPSATPPAPPRNGGGNKDAAPSPAAPAAPETPAPADDNK
ncbi:MAG TPA: OmpA family protein [Tepidisphaeraceae bacterium]|jgi:chemotaxis protein MotB